jgi:hypothetical protein
LRLYITISFRCTPYTISSRSTPATIFFRCTLILLYPSVAHAPTTITSCCTCQVEDLPTLARDGAKSNDSSKLGFLYSSCSVLKMMLSPQHFPRMLCSALLPELQGPSPEYESMVLEFASLRDLWIFFMYVLYSTLLRLPPLRFRCVGEPRRVATSALAVRRSSHSGITARPGNMLRKRASQGVTTRCRLFGLTISDLVYQR